MSDSVSVSARSDLVRRVEALPRYEFYPFYRDNVVLNAYGDWVKWDDLSALLAASVPSATQAVEYCRSCDHTHLIGTPCWFHVDRPVARQEPSDV